MHIIPYLLQILTLFRDLGRNPTILSVEDGVAHICRGNGSLIHVSLVPFPDKLLKHVAGGMWPAALQVRLILDHAQVPQSGYVVVSSVNYEF